MKCKLNLLFLAICFSIVSRIDANHTMGGQITYKFVSGTTYKVRLTLYRNCSSNTQLIPLPWTVNVSALNVRIKRLDNVANCNQAPLIFPVLFKDTNIVSNVCSSILTTCNGGNTPGVMEFIFESDINFGAGNRFEIWWGEDPNDCCRAPSINYNPAGFTQVVHTTMFKGNFPTNNSPVVNNNKLPFICTNKPPECYEINAVDVIDPNTSSSLVYDIVSTADASIPPNNGPANCFTNPFPYTSAGYNAGYSLNQPFGVTKPVCFNLAPPYLPSTLLIPTMLGSESGVYVVVIKITEFNTTVGSPFFGDVMSVIYRDFIVTVDNGGFCSNASGLDCFFAPPIVSLPAVPILGDTFKICEGDSLKAKLVINDPSNQNLFVTKSNVLNPNDFSPWLVANLSGNGTPTFIIDIKAKIPNTYSDFDIYVDFNNGACPIPSFRTKKFHVKVIKATHIAPDSISITKCGLDVINLKATGNQNYIWTDISGGPAQSIDCNNCANVNVAPTITTTYVVESFPKSINAFCKYKDTITIKVAPDFILTASSNDNKVCYGTPVQLLADISLPPTGFTYLWTRLDDNGNPVLPLYLNSATDKNPTAIISPIGSAIPPGVYTYQVDATSPEGCKRTDVITVNVTQEKVPQFTLSQSQKLFCNYNGAASINASAVFTPPPISTNCQISNGEPCYGDPSPFLGTTNAISSSNAPTQPGLLAGAQKNMRQQYLFTMAELATKGIPNKGKISAISFYVNNLIPDLNKDYKSYSNVTIKIGCTNLNSLAGLALNGPFSAMPSVTVYNKALRIKQGLNEIKFTNVNNLIAFEYDGTSATPNFIIEITSISNSNASTNATPQVELMSSFYTSSIFNSGATMPTTIINSSSSKPNFKFRYCSNSPTDNTVNTFNWISNLSSAVFSNSTVANPTINFTQSGTYTLNCEVTTASKACKENKSIQVFVRPKPNFDLSALSNYLSVCSNNNNFDILNYVSPKLNVTFSGTSAITNSIFGTFNPSLASNGNHTVLMTVQDSTQYAVAPNGPCISTENITIKVDAYKPATITNKGILNKNYCIDDKTIYALKIIPMQTGVFSGALNSNGEFVPANLGIGLQTLYYTTPAPCGAKDSFQITIHKKPDVTINLDETNLCIPVTAKLNANTDPNQGFYKWQFNSGQTSNTQNADVIYTRAISDKIELEFTDNFGCKNTAEKTINTLAKPKAMFIPSTNKTTTFSPIINFENTSVEVLSTNSEYKWKIGNLGETFGKNTSFNFENNPGNHSISLFVKSSNGCEDTYTDNVNITLNYALFVPTAFNPNSSNATENRKLFVKSVGLQKDFIKFQIYDRLGAKVFESLDFTTFWNGKVNNSGSYCEPGIYVWKATIRDISNKSYELNGNTVLLK